MLKHFQVPEDIAVRVDVDKLRSATEQVFMKCGVPESEARLGADVLMFADESGIDTHGVSNMLRSYVGFQLRSLSRRMIPNERAEY